MSLTSGHAKLVVESIKTAVSVRSALVSFCTGHLPAILESSHATYPYGRYSVLACDPAAVVTIEADARRGVDVVEALQNSFAKWPLLASAPTGMPTCVGWIGYLSYEAGLPLVGLASRSSRPYGVSPACCNTASGPALARFCLYDHVAVFDAWHQRWFAVAVDWPTNTPICRPSLASRIAAIRDLLGQHQQDGHDRKSHVRADQSDTSAMESNRPSQYAERSSASSSLTRGGKMERSAAVGARLVDACPGGAGKVFCAGDNAEPKISASMTRRKYFHQFDQAMSYIEAGDIYEVNLAIRFNAQTSLLPIEQYLRLRACSPSTHAAFLPWDDYAIISTSPELFLKLGQGQVITRPIKGTRPRADDLAIDEAYRRDLVRSDKDRAELNMIVDLMRNDLGRVCDYGSVRVIESSAIEALPTVYQQVATIQGRLAQRLAWSDLLRASFPGGSITGAPKIRAMQIIEELEPVAREVYCGSIGIIGLDGSMTMNIAIRTMVQRGDRVTFWAGGAIVADSDPQAEYDEILTKTVGLRRALVNDQAHVTASA